MPNKITRLTLPTLLQLSDKCIGNAYNVILLQTNERQQGELNKWVTDISGISTIYYDRHKMPRVLKVLTIYKYAQLYSQSTYLANIRIDKGEYSILINNINLVQ